MNPVPEKWRVTFAPAAQPGSVACARVAVPPDLEVWQDNNGNVCAYGYIADGYGWMDLVGTGKFSGWVMIDITLVNSGEASGE